MNKLIPIKIPLLNPNEPQALLVALEAAEGERVEAGQVIAVIETTKSTGDVHTETDGYLVGLRYQEGDTVRAGDALAYVGDSPAASDSSLPPWAAGHPTDVADTPPAGLRITDPARKLAVEKGLKLDSLPRGPLVTIRMVEEELARRAPVRPAQVPEGEDRLVIYGAGGHGRSLAALVQTTGNYSIMGLLDDGYEPGQEVFGLPILGGGEKLHQLAIEGIRLAVNGVGGIGDLQSRLKVYDLFHQAGFHCPTVIHPTAFLEDSASLEDAVQVYPLAYVGTQTQIGYGTILNTGAIVSHNAILGPYVNLSPGATLAGDVIVDECVLIGMGATLNLGVHVGKHARIGNGATVKADVPDGGIVPAGTIWPPRHS